MTEAEKIIREALRPYFTASQIQQLLPLLQNEVVAGEQINQDRLMAEIRNTNVYKERFAGIIQRQQAGLTPVSEAEYLNLERQYAQIMRAAGLPSGFYDRPDDFATLIARDVSVAEWSQRVQNGYVAMRTADATVKAELRNRYGVTDGELAAYFMDPDRAMPLLETQVATARLGAAASRAGVDGVETQRLEQLARLGVSTQQAEQGFAAIAGDAELYQALDAGESAISMDTALDATFAGNAAARQAIRNRKERRAARFQEGGSFAGSGATRTGLTSA